MRVDYDQLDKVIDSLTRGEEDTVALMATSIATGSVLNVSLKHRTWHVLFSNLDRQVLLLFRARAFCFSSPLAIS